MNDVIKYKSTIATFAGKGIPSRKRKHILNEECSQDEAVEEVSE
jgi:hypothetical protein